MTRLGGIRIVCGAMLCICLNAACGDSRERYELMIGEHGFSVEIADSEESRRQGLMFREKLEADHGMLFVFDEETERSFWMKDTPLPLSIAYIDSRRVIQEILPMTPFSTAPVPSNSPAKYALEVNQGVFEQLGIEVGDRVSFSRELMARINRE